MQFDSEYLDTDVIVVGQGVVGQFLSLLLAQRGHRVLAVERHSEPYALPRAVHYDPDVNRVLAGLGLDAEEQATFSRPNTSYDWLTADHRLMLAFPTPLDGAQGWPDSTMFAQPDLEAALRRHQRQAETLQVRWGTTLTDIAQNADGVTATLSSAVGTETVRAAFLVGCDGANSTVRELAGLVLDDLGFTSDWLVMDLKVDEARVFAPDCGQICDPARPTSCVSGGPGRRRFEIMRMPEDDMRDFSTPASAWQLVEPWNIDPSNAELERLAVYTFHARCAPEWQAGRVFIGGDAAHQMPPFFGRGMVSGVRDVVNLYWKLDLVLRGNAPQALLESYGSERYAHIQYALNMSVELGNIICETDPVKVAARDAHFLERGPLPENALPPMPPEVLGPGFFPGGVPGEDPVAGRVGVQGRVQGLDGKVRPLDEVTFHEFVTLLDGRRVSSEEASRVRAARPAGIACKVIRIVAAGAEIEDMHTARDIDARYTELFDHVGRLAIVYRPDLHGFGSASTPEGAVDLVAALDPTLLRGAQ